MKKNSFPQIIFSLKIFFLGNPRTLQGNKYSTHKNHRERGHKGINTRFLYFDINIIFKTLYNRIEKAKHTQDHTS